MNKPRSSSTSLSLLIIAALTILTSSCNGQKKGNNTENTELSAQTVTETSTSAYEESQKQISQVVRMMFQDSKGDLWFGAEAGAFRLSNNVLTLIDGIGDSERGATIKDIVESTDGKIWIGHTGGISYVDGEHVTNYNEFDGLISNDVWCIETDKNNHVWIGTIEGVCKFDGDKFSAFELPEGIKDTTVGVSSTKMIHDIFEDSEGRIWFSTNNGVFIKDNSSLKNLAEKDGLKTSLINKVIETQSGNYWISTSKGLYAYDEETITEVSGTVFDETKGIGSIAEDSNENIWFNCSRSIYCLKDGDLTEYRIAEGNNGPLTFQIYKDQQGRLWFVGYGGAYRLENGEFLNITKNGPW